MTESFYLSELKVGQKWIGFEAKIKGTVQRTSSSILSEAAIKTSTREGLSQAKVLP